MKSNTKGKIYLVFNYISTIISWTVFVLLALVCAFLLYFFIASRLYVTYGDKYEPYFSIYTIVSGSMEPNINIYDVIINSKASEDDIKVNDVITFTSTSDISMGKTVTHRVIDIKKLDDDSKCFVTRGDNNTQQDSSCVSENNIIGKVAAVIPGLGRIQFFLSSSFGWLCIIVVPALYIIIKDVIKLLRLRKNDEEYIEEDYDKTTKVDKLVDEINIIDDEVDITENEEFVNQDNTDEEIPEVKNKIDEVNEDEIDLEEKDNEIKENSNDEGKIVARIDVIDEDDDEDEEEFDLPTLKSD